jgi:hypothetical protein
MVTLFSMKLNLLLDMTEVIRAVLNGRILRYKASHHAWAVGNQESFTTSPEKLLREENALHIPTVPWFLRRQL